MASILPSFADFILFHARTRPEKPAIVLADRVVTYEMMAQGMMQAERRLRALGLAPGTLVGIAIASPIRHLIIAAALFRLGYPSISVRRIADVLPLGLPIGAFLHAENEQIHVGQLQVFVGDDWFTGEPMPIGATRSAGFSDNRAICRVELSSGTTGRPKAVSLSVEVLYRWLISYYPWINLGNWDRLLSLLGLTSSFGFSLAAHVLFAGKTMAFAPTPRDCLHMTSVYGLDALVVSPQQLRELVHEQTVAPIPCPTLRAILVGGSLLSRSLMLESGAKLCTSIISSYGSTEVGGSAFATMDRISAIEGATGYIVPWAEIEVVDEDGNQLPPDTEGILRIRAAYQGEPFPPDRPDAHPAFRDGWFYPGDRGRVASDGLLVVSGRASEVINVGGVKVAPAAIEEALQRHPAVVEAMAFGSVGQHELEEIVTVIVRRSPVNEQAIIDWCAEAGVPVARVVFVEELPKTSSGKIHRDLVSRQFG